MCKSPVFLRMWANDIFEDNYAKNKTKSIYMILEKHDHCICNPCACERILNKMITRKVKWPLSGTKKCVKISPKDMVVHAHIVPTNGYCFKWLLSGATFKMTPTLNFTLIQTSSVKDKVSNKNPFGEAIITCNLVFTQISVLFSNLVH